MCDFDVEIVWWTYKDERVADTTRVKAPNAALAAISVLAKLDPVNEEVTTVSEVHITQPKEEP